MPSTVTNSLLKEYPYQMNKNGKQKISTHWYIWRRSVSKLLAIDAGVEIIITLSYAMARRLTASGMLSQIFQNKIKIKYFYLNM